MTKYLAPSRNLAPNEPSAPPSRDGIAASVRSQGVGLSTVHKAEPHLDQPKAPAWSQITSGISCTCRAIQTSANLSPTKIALNALYHSRLHRIAQPFTRGLGAIIMLHQMSLETPATFAPNAFLKVTPAFLDNVIRLVLDLGFDVISLDEVYRRLDSNDCGRPFVSFTFDDGYRDNYELAYPIFKKYNAPFAVYVPTNFPDGNGLLWWEALELVVSRLSEIQLPLDTEKVLVRCRTQAEKSTAYKAIIARLWMLKELEAHKLVRKLCCLADVDTYELNRRLIMTWDELRALGADTLVTIGAHTQNHFALAKLPARQAREEVEGSLRRIERELGEPPRHFAYPYGRADCAGPREFAMLREAGVKTAVTTRKGMLFAAHAAHTTALPRISLNGRYQDLRYMEVLLSGLPSALLNGFRNGSRQP